jgi:hypothetical protein
MYTNFRVLKADRVIVIADDFDVLMRNLFAIPILLSPHNLPTVHYGAMWA